MAREARALGRPVEATILFMVPSGFIASGAQTAFAAANAIHPADPASERVAMTWDQVRALDRAGHVIGCHTMNHTRLSSRLDATALDIEIRGAKEALRRELGHDV